LIFSLIFLPFLIVNDFRYGYVLPAYRKLLVLVICAVACCRCGYERCQQFVRFGVAQYQSPDLWDEFVNRADEFLYKAKQDGKNRVVLDIPKSEGRKSVMVESFSL